ncbi:MULTISPECIES: hypothetical protein [Methylobacterium]|jgi:hypothetical protein|uniref:Uncharacterized protein n=1 Tax=Methylobacterium longum TaxID=767694 RepID=A0ABT8AIX4_9HYPH|nr:MULTISPECIES: hypothetical protein [Methylobacterium]MCJ2101387.1 hypothetical protein [Methylobacterium sp. E-046]MDN3569784.1 hypothetical protein [Methylobacterium longum]GJE11818.1 hypothetical protein FOHLNKBM_2862 [Methylobacterium longum]
MTRIAILVVTGLSSLALTAGASMAADPARSGPSVQGQFHGSVTQARPRWSYYGEYQYPMPFGYGYAYAAIERPGFEYGYNGPRYVWSAPDR